MPGNHISLHSPTHRPELLTHQPPSHPSPVSQTPTLCGTLKSRRKGEARAEPAPLSYLWLCQPPFPCKAPATRPRGQQQHESGHHGGGRPGRVLPAAVWGAPVTTAAVSVWGSGASHSPQPPHFLPVPSPTVTLSPKSPALSPWHQPTQPLAFQMPTQPSPHTTPFPHVGARTPPPPALGWPSPSRPLGTQNPPASPTHVWGRKFPNIEDQSESPSLRLLEKKKEAKLMHHAMEQKKEVGRQARSAGRPRGSEPEDGNPPFCGWQWLEPEVLHEASAFPPRREKGSESWG